MGRQNKVGLDYFELDCHMDEKVELIEAEFGLKGFAIIVKLYQRIYSGFGYYCEWTPDISLLWARRLGVSHGGDMKGLGGMLEESFPSGSKGRLGYALDKGSLPGFPDNLINGVVAASIRRGIFSKELFNKYHILTSSGIQKRYLNAVSKREKVEVKKEYLLFSIPQNIKNVVINSISDGRNEINDGRNTQSKEEESREENIICDDDDTCARAKEIAFLFVDKYWGRKATDADTDKVRGLILSVKDRTVLLNTDKVKLLEYAFECSTSANALNWHYIHGVIQRLKARGITTVEQAHEFDFKRDFGG